MAYGSPRILLTGATGYLGGTILTTLVNAQDASIRKASVSCLVRQAEQADKLHAAYGKQIETVLYKDLEDLDATIEVASQHDVVINAGIGYYAGAAKALIKGLAKRKQQTGTDVWMIHTSGTSCLEDQPITGAYSEPDPERISDDSVDDIYSYEKMRNELQPYIQRTSGMAVIDVGLELGVKTLVIMPPTVYGVGTGHFKRSSYQVPAYARAALLKGQAIVVGEGKGVVDHVHVEDAAELYRLCLLNILDKDGVDLLGGKKGITFCDDCRHSWKKVAQGVADAALAAGKIKTAEVKSVDLREAADLWVGGDLFLAELGFCATARTRGTFAREKLGWKPMKGPSDWGKGFAEEVEAAAELKH